MKKLQVLNDGEFEGLNVSVKDAARILSLSVRQVWYFISKKELVTRRHGGKRVVLVSSIRSFNRKDHPVPSPKRSNR